MSHSIAFTRFVEKGQSLIGGSTWLVDPDGKHLRQLASVTRSDTRPAWSPDGTRIAFSGGEDVGMSQIYVIGSDGEDLVRLTCNNNSLQAAWSPDGTRLLIVQHPRSGISDSLYAMNADGSGLKLILHSDNDNFYYLSWSPDGQWIAATRTDGQAGSIWLFKPDGTSCIN